jgi:hypothetical protein
MNLAPTTYVPALKWRQGEYQALLRLADAAKPRIVPFLIIPPVEYDFEEGEPKKSREEQIESFPKRLKAKWGTRAAWVDVDASLHEAKLAGYNDAFSFVFGEIRKFGSLAVPAASIDYSAGVLKSIANIRAADKRGVALRVRLEHLMAADFQTKVADLLKTLITPASETDLIIDLGNPAYEPYDVFAKALIGTFSKLTNLDSFRSFVVIGTAYPDSVQDIAVPGGEIERSDWIFFKRLIAAMPASMRRPNFGDYTIVNPTFTANFDMRMIKPAGKVVYTFKDKWMIRKGGSFRDNRTQMHQHCAHIVKSGAFRGQTYSSGDDYIGRCARKEADAGPSTLTRWKEIGISHHIMHVLEDLATAGA